MKRLKNILLGMEQNTTTYRQMYEGAIRLVDPLFPSIPPETEYSPIYYDGDVGFEFSVTHKLAQDKPTVVISIPCSTLGIDPPGQTTRTAIADFCLRRFNSYIDELNADLYNRSRPDAESGKYYVCVPGGEVVARNAAFFSVRPQKDYENGPGMITAYILRDGVPRPPVLCLCIRLQVQLPRKKIRKTVQMLCKDLPSATQRFIAEFDYARLRETVTLAEKQNAIRRWLSGSAYCAFVANGSILPRAKASDLPLPDAIPFRSVPGDEIEVAGVRGMGFKRGVTVITGGGYSGKSTLLDAISAGIYDHVLGDGRELCITDESAVTISAEDGRSVKHVNVSPFIKWLPGGDTNDFSTEHASGSTSQSANIMEAIDGGSKLLLIDEDRSATNFMIRDRMMKELIEREPITPFTDRVNELHFAHGVSTVLVIGGSGEYLSVCDRVYLMDEFKIRDATEAAKQICEKESRPFCSPPPADWSQNRTLFSDRFSSYPAGSGSEKLTVSEMGFVLIGDEKIDVRGLHNVVSTRQLNALGFMLRYLEISNTDRIVDLNKKIANLYKKIEDEGVDAIYSAFFTTCERFLDLPRRQELIALINRMRHTNTIKGGVKI